MSEYLHRYQMLVKKFSLSSNCRIGDPFSVFPILFVKLPFQNYSLEDKTLGQYRYALDSTGMFWAVPVLPRCFISQTELSWYALLSVKTATKKVIVICAIKMYVV